MEFVKPDLHHRPRLSIGEDYGLPNKFILSLLELAQDRGGTVVGCCHGGESDSLAGWGGDSRSWVVETDL
jgi:hypothetical protein